MMRFMTLGDYLMLLPVGLLAGASGGLLGIGGSVVMIPGLVILFGPHQHHLYQAAAMLVNFFVVGPSVIRHQAAGATLPPITRWMVPGAIIGAAAGVYLSELPVFRGAGQGYLQIGFAIFLAYVMVYNVKRLVSRSKMPAVSEGDAARNPPWRTFCLIGLPAGLTGGLLGVGGGLFAVPAQQLFLRVPLRNAIANSATTILWSSLVGALYKTLVLSSHGHDWTESLSIAAFLMPPAVLGAWYTAAKVHVWPVKVIRVAFLTLLFYAAIRLLVSGWQQVAGII